MIRLTIFGSEPRWFGTRAYRLGVASRLLRLVLILCFSFGLGAPLDAQEASPAEPQPTLPPAPEKAPPKAAWNVAPSSLDDLAWLQGQWNGEWGPRTATQIWTAPRAGMILGTLQIVENNKTSDVEFFMITQTSQGVEYRVLHFTPSLSPWAPASLYLASTDSRGFLFKNPSAGQPQQILLNRVDADTYTSQWEIRHDTSDPLAWDITFHRQKTSAGSGEHR